jgi:hypothetical protein
LAPFGRTYPDDAQHPLQRFEPSCDDMTGAQIKSGHS